MNVSPVSRKIGSVDFSQTYSIILNVYIVMAHLYPCICSFRGYELIDRFCVTVNKSLVKTHVISFSFAFLTTRFSINT